MEKACGYSAVPVAHDSQIVTRMCTRGWETLGVETVEAEDFGQKEQKTRREPAIARRGTLLAKMAPVIPSIIPVYTALCKCDFAALPRSRVYSPPLKAGHSHVTCLGKRDISKCDVSRDLEVVKQIGAHPLLLVETGAPPCAQAPWVMKDTQREALANQLRLHISEAILDLSGPGEPAQTIRTTESSHRIMKKDKYLLF